MDWMSTTRREGMRTVITRGQYMGALIQITRRQTGGSDDAAREREPVRTVANRIE